MRYAGAGMCSCCLCQSVAKVLGLSQWSSTIRQRPSMLNGPTPSSRPVSPNQPTAHLWQFAHQVCLLRPRLGLALLGASGRKVRLQQSSNSRGAGGGIGGIRVPPPQWLWRRQPADVPWRFIGLGAPLLLYSPPLITHSIPTLSLSIRHSTSLPSTSSCSSCCSGSPLQRQQGGGGGGAGSGGVAAGMGVPARLKEVTIANRSMRASHPGPMAPAPPAALTCRRECTRSGRFCP